MQLKSLAAPTSPTLFELQRVKPFIDHPGRTANPGINRNRFHWAVKGTGTALHAEIGINDLCFAILNLEKIVRTDFRTDITADASATIQEKCGNSLQIDKVFQANLLMTIITNPARIDKA
jgi:hypothetical protein